jgi:hypothetical protein
LLCSWETVQGLDQGHFTLGAALDQTRELGR